LEDRLRERLGEKRGGRSYLRLSVSLEEKEKRCRRAKVSGRFGDALGKEGFFKWGGDKRGSDTCSRGPGKLSAKFGGRVEEEDSEGPEEI